MHCIERSILVSYSAEQMFRLVTAIDAYPMFLPGCVAARASNRPDGKVDVTMEIDYHGVRARFTTRNEYVEFAEVRMDLVDGPFRQLEGEWTFKEMRTDACRVRLRLSYEFAGGLLGRAVAPVFGLLAGSLVDAFSQRADVAYADAR